MANEYSNGFNLAEVKQALYGRLAWRPSTKAGSPVPTGTNATSKSGRFYNDFHPLCSLEIIKELQDNPQLTDLQLNQELESLSVSVMMGALNGVFNEPEYLERGVDFISNGEQNDREIPNAGLFVGRLIRPAVLPDISLQIDAVNLYFNKDLTLPIYLYQHGQRNSIKSLDVDAHAWERTRVPLEDWILRAGLSGRAFYVGYFQDDVEAAGAMAIDETRLYTDAGLWGLDFIQRVVTNPGEFDRRQHNSSTWSHGLGLEISAFRDRTADIVKKPGLFDELQGLAMAATILERSIHSLRSNKTERILKEQLISLGFMELTGALPAPDGPKIQGLKQRIDREISRIKKTFNPNDRGASYSSLDLC